MGKKTSLQKVLLEIVKCRNKTAKWRNKIANATNHALPDVSHITVQGHVTLQEVSLTVSNSHHVHSSESNIFKDIANTL